MFINKYVYFLLKIFADSWLRIVLPKIGHGLAVFARTRPRLTVRDLSKNKTKPARPLRLAVRTECLFRERTGLIYNTRN